MFRAETQRLLFSTFPVILLFFATLRLCAPIRAPVFFGSHNCAGTGGADVEHPTGFPSSRENRQVSCLAQSRQDAKASVQYFPCHLALLCDFASLRANPSAGLLQFAQLRGHGRRGFRTPHGLPVFTREPPGLMSRAKSPRRKAFCSVLSLTSRSSLRLCGGARFADRIGDLARRL